MNDIGLKLDLRQAVRLARPIIRKHDFNRRMVETLAEHIVREARDVRGAQLRRVVGKRRRVMSLNHARWWDRRDMCADLDADIWAAVEAIRGERASPALELAA